MPMHKFNFHKSNLKTLKRNPDIQVKTLLEIRAIRYRTKYLKYL